MILIPTNMILKATMVALVFMFVFDLVFLIIPIPSLIALFFGELSALIFRYVLLAGFVYMVIKNPWFILIGIVLADILHYLIGSSLLSVIV